MTEKFYPLYHDGELDAQSLEILEQISGSSSAPLSSLTAQEVRDSFFIKSWLGTPRGDVTIENLIIENSGNKIPLRIYTPEGSGPHPILLFFHGGGFVAGYIHEFDAFCTYLAHGASCKIISVDYRLSPEHKHPAAVEDARAALKWAAENAKVIGGDGNRIAVAGDSAGGNLALVSSIMARDESFPSIIYQVLICPWLDLSSTNTDSYKLFGDGLWLSKANIYWYRNNYLKNEEQANSYLASPMFTEKLEGLPPTFIVAAEFDVLRDEGKIFADRLRSEGIPVKYSCYKGMLHDFITVPGLFSKAKEATEDVCRILKKVFYE
jgi:acetyl esterase